MNPYPQASRLGSFLFSFPVYPDTHYTRFCYQISRRCRLCRLTFNRKTRKHLLIRRRRTIIAMAKEQARNFLDNYSAGNCFKLLCCLMDDRPRAGSSES